MFKNKFTIKHKLTTILIFVFSIYTFLLLISSKISFYIENSIYNEAQMLKQIYTNNSNIIAPYTYLQSDIKNLSNIEFFLRISLAIMGVASVIYMFIIVYVMVYRGKGVQNEHR